MDSPTAVPMALLKFQIGPVQEFIAQARSTRDLWSGSYLLSFLISAGARKLQESSGELIFPNPKGQPLLEAPESWVDRDIHDQRALLTPNLPNLFVAEVPLESAKKTAGDVEAEIKETWERIATSCFHQLKTIGVLQAPQKRDFLAQANALLSISWQITPLGGDYTSAYRQNGHRLDAVRQTRDFPANPVCLSGEKEKDSLSGRDHAFVRGRDALDACTREDYKQFFKHENDHLSAITLIKRVWHLAYLHDKHGLKTASKEFPIRSTHAIAARSTKLDDEENTDTATGEKYLAAIAFDGDSIGDWVSGERLGDPSRLYTHHQNFSAALSDFAMGKVREIVEKIEDGNGGKIPLGFLIYAGGDDVVALVPAEAALDVARELREAFRESTDKIVDKTGKSPDASAGIAIGHFKAPLQDLVRAAQVAEKRAKNAVGRPAFSVTLMKRSGEISEWGDRWDDGGIDLHEKIAELMGDIKLGGRFPHRVCQLLSPYLSQQDDFSCLEDAIEDADTALDLIRREFQHAAKRQSSDGSVAKSLMPLLDTYLANILKRRQEREQKASSTHQPANRSLTQELLESVIGLCVSVAFANRLGDFPSDSNSDSDSQPSAERQPAV